MCVVAISPQRRSGIQHQLLAVCANIQAIRTIDTSDRSEENSVRDDLIWNFFIRFSVGPAFAQCADVYKSRASCIRSIWIITPDAILFVALLFYFISFQAIVHSQMGIIGISTINSPWRLASSWYIVQVADLCSDLLSLFTVQYYTPMRAKLAHQRCFFYAKRNLHRSKWNACFYFYRFSCSDSTRRKAWLNDTNQWGICRVVHTYLLCAIVAMASVGFLCFRS